MIDQGGARRYPPAEDAYRYPPPPVRRGWFWVALLAGPLAVVALVLAVVVLVSAEQRDATGLIDDPEVADVVSVQCRLMTSTVEGLPVLGTPQRKAEVLADQNRAVRIMVERIRRIDAETRTADRPVDDWLGDWERLVEAREAYAEQVADGFTGRLEVPQADGDDITVRMDQAASAAPCEVPDALLESYLDGSVDA